MEETRDTRLVRAWIQTDSRLELEVVSMAEEIVKRMQGRPAEEQFDAMADLLCNYLLSDMNESLLSPDFFDYTEVAWEDIGTDYILYVHERDALAEEVMREETERFMQMLEQVDAEAEELMRA